jgi:hypothetical protein
MVDFLLTTNDIVLLFVGTIFYAITAIIVYVFDREPVEEHWKFSLALFVLLYIPAMLIYFPNLVEPSTEILVLQLMSTISLPIVGHFCILKLAGKRENRFNEFEGLLNQIERYARDDIRNTDSDYAREFATDLVDDCLPKMRFYFWVLKRAREIGL